MGKAFKCDLTGEMREGEGLTRIDVDITPTLRLEIIPHNKIDESHFGQAVLSAEAAARITKQLQGLDIPKRVAPAPATK